MSETIVPSVTNFACPGCSEPAAVSTKTGVPIACPCGMSHVTKAVVVETEGTCADPHWAEKRRSADRAARAKGDK